LHHEMRGTPGIPVIHTGPREADRAPRRRTGLGAWGPFTRRRSREVRGHNRLELRMQQDWIGANQLHELRRRRCRARRFRHPRSLTGRSSSRVGLLVRWISLETALASGSSPDLTLQARCGPQLSCAVAAGCHMADDGCTGGNKKPVSGVVGGVSARVLDW
jgi:hypothetical protein